MIEQLARLEEKVDGIAQVIMEMREEIRDLKFIKEELKYLKEIKEFQKPHMFLTVSIF